MVEQDVNFEEQCEDAVFDLAEVRERYPEKCAQELAKSLELTRKINMIPVKLPSRKSSKPFELTANERELLENFKITSRDRKKQQKALTNDLTSMLSEIHNLKSVIQQIKTNEDSTIEMALKKIRRNP